MFPAQRRVYNSKSRWKTVTTARRCGKSIALVAIAAESLHQSKDGEVTLCATQDRGRAKDLFWDKLIALRDAYDLPWEANASELRLTNTVTGGVLLVRGIEGANLKRQLKKGRGLKLRTAIIDEAQDCVASLRLYLRETIEPALGDTRGTCIVAGTPGEVMGVGAWWELSAVKENKWEKFRWSLRDNPHFPNADEYLQTVLDENHWTVDDPTFQREYDPGWWAVDESVQVYRYLAARNDRNKVPGYDRATWTHTIGVDFGQKDSTAWVVLASHPHSTDTYVIDCYSETGLSSDAIADKTAEYVAMYKPDTLVGDGGNLGGNLLIQAINRRKGCNMVSAKKTEKRAQIEILNSDLRAPRLFFLQPATEALTEELVTLPWANETKQKSHPGYQDHLSDALLYAHRHHRAYLHEAPTPKVYKPYDPSSDEVIEAELRALNKKWWMK